jgi:hypothetical protein
MKIGFNSGLIKVLPHDEVTNDNDMENRRYLAQSRFKYSSN